MPEFKLGEYARYQGKEYPACDNLDGTVALLTSDPAQQSNGFKLSRTGSFVKTVPRSAVEALYLVKPKAIYKGVRVAVLRMDGDTVHIAMGGTPPDEGWISWDRNDHIKILPFAELDHYWLDVKEL